MQRKERHFKEWQIKGRSIAYDQRRLLLFILSSIAAVYAGFFLFSPHVLKNWIQQFGYYFITAVFFLFLYFAVRVWKDGRARHQVGFCRADFGLYAWILVCSLFIYNGDAFAHKILFDEYILQATSLGMHLEKQVSAATRGHWIQGSYMLWDDYLDKRPYFFSYLLSLVHDFTGYRERNVFILNAALVPCFLYLVSRIASVFSGKGAAFFAVALLGTLPLLAQSATGGGMEMLNLTMVALVLHASLLYFTGQTKLRLGYLCLSSVLLAQCRYESLLYLGAVGFVILLAWWRSGRIQITYPLILTPIFIIPSVWHSRFVDSDPLLWELKDGQVFRFSSDYFESNLRGLFNFFCNVGTEIPNSPLMALIGLVAIVVGVAVLSSKLFRREAFIFEWLPIFIFGLFSLCSMGLFLFYYWARMDDVMASRFSLPFHLFLALGGAWAIARLARSRTWVVRSFWGLWIAHLMIFFLPMSSTRLFSVTNMVAAEVDWQVTYVGQLPKVPRLVISFSPLPWVVNQYSTVSMHRARGRTEQIEYHVREGTFHEVLIVQTLTPTSLAGDFTVSIGHEIPAHWTMQTIAIKRFGGRLVRISRVVFN